ncbi:MAG: YraN family protein [Pseudobutyrivibrio sp.]|nr:YraN family protein [Pseudobutyrivibrio sp.]
MNQRSQGNSYEKLAAKYLEEKGFSIVEFNFFSKTGELDIIAKDKEYLVFIEVKYRKNKRKGSAAEAVTFSKMKKICRTADYYMLTHGMNDSTSVRFDVVAIEEGKLTHIPNAFDYIPIR